jgi:cytidyltransferase-like protein
MKMIGIASGFFNPLHVGHLDYLEEAKRNCDHLVVVVNTDKQVEMKGAVPFMPLVDRMRIVMALECVDLVLASESKDKTVTEDIREINNLFKNDLESCHIRFFNSGDRTFQNTPEIKVCSELGIQLMILDQPKIRASSKIINNAIKN